VSGSGSLSSWHQGPLLADLTPAGTPAAPMPANPSREPDRQPEKRPSATFVIHEADIRRRRNGSRVGIQAGARTGVTHHTAVPVHSAANGRPSRVPWHLDPVCPSGEHP